MDYLQIGGHFLKPKKIVKLWYVTVDEITGLTISYANPYYDKKLGCESIMFFIVNYDSNKPKQIKKDLLAILQKNPNIVIVNEIEDNDIRNIVKNIINKK